MIRIVEATEEHQRRQLRLIDSSFLVESELKLTLLDGMLTYEGVPVSPYEKRYTPEEVEAKPPHTTFLALDESALAGGVELSPSWNGFVYVHHVAVQPDFRRSGVAAALIGRAIAWSQSERLAGVRAETQSNNVAACALYAQAGFDLCGFDSAIYRGLSPPLQEVALFWYWQPSPASGGAVTPNHSIERTPSGKLRLPAVAAHVKR